MLSTAIQMITQCLLAGCYYIFGLEARIYVLILFVNIIVPDSVAEGAKNSTASGAE